MTIQGATGHNRLDRVGVVVIFVVALAIGFAFGLQDFSQDETTRSTVPVDKKVRFDSSSAVSGTMDDGWSSLEAWGTWMKQHAASILLGFDGPAEGDVELLIDARTRPTDGTTPAILSVQFNDVEIARWWLSRETRSLRRRYIIPKAIFNRSSVGRLTFILMGETLSSTQFGLEAVELRDARRLTAFNGHVDRCTTNDIAGWAVAEDSAVNVAATINGEPLKAIFVNVERPDLEAHGLPVAAGFKLMPPRPISPGSTINVLFANGRSLKGSPCQAN